MIKDKSTDLCGNKVLHNDSINTFCEILLRFSETEETSLAGQQKKRRLARVRKT